MHAPRGEIADDFPAYRSGARAGPIAAQRSADILLVIPAGLAPTVEAFAEMDKAGADREVELRTLR